MTNLLVVVPTRGRPEAVDQMVRAFVDTGVDRRAALLFGVDDDDPKLGAYQVAVSDHAGAYPFPVGIQVGPRKRMVGTLNELAVQHAGDCDAIGFLGDDHRPRGVWLDPVLDALADRPRIVYGDDGFQGEACPTACFITSDIVETLGYFAPPALIHLEADLVWLEWGQETGRIVYLPDVSIEHMHPSAGKGDWDAGYAAVNSVEMYTVDRATNRQYHADGSFQRDVDKIRALIA